jgi:predicted RNA-binding Zn ribbon-like protein
MAGSAGSLEPGGRKPAPEPLRLVQRFVNSYDHLTDRGVIETPEALDRWIGARGLTRGTRPTQEELRYVQDVRESIRSILKANNGAPLDATIVDRLNKKSPRARLVFRLQEDGRPSVVSGAVGASGVVATVLAAAAEAAHRGIWDRLKACRECGWVFYDRSKNRSGSWCTMAICGSRSKMRAYRKRSGAIRA